MTIRTFFSVDIKDKNIIKQLTQTQNEFQDVKAKINFVPPENFHYTLKFLGDIEETIIEQLQDASEAIKFKPFTVNMHGVNCIPSKSYIRVIYVGASSGETELQEIATQLESISKTFGFKPAKRPFKAHLTLCRVKNVYNKKQLVDRIEQLSDTSYGEIEIDAFQLKQSVLKPTGAEYSTLFEVTAQ
ncbi:MAG: RNA 2',3'-cyclic phosphodiesterase [Asgard group archaeon]|nr:RNA 2',3'-cyclic phosphodiesterase [Asgard group archaeon]